MRTKVFVLDPAGLQSSHTFGLRKEYKLLVPKEGGNVAIAVIGKIAE
jgi:hypothetical protein